MWDATYDLASLIRGKVRSVEAEKKKYTTACVACCASFTPLRFSVDGMIGTEANFFLHQLADKLSSKWEKPYSLVMSWVHVRLSFVILWAPMICVHGSRMKWRSLGISNGSLAWPDCFSSFVLGQGKNTKGKKRSGHTRLLQW